jgi:glyoxylase-like metal-dependent hydrolase (beta-lactamase superfamily II)
MSDINIETITVGQYKTNCYVLINNSSRNALIIDPGDEADFIIRKITDFDVTPVNIIATHGHFDHVSAVFELQNAYKIPFLLHQKDDFLISRTSTTYNHFMGLTGVINPKTDYYLKEQDNVELNNEVFKILEIPGHTPGSIAVYLKKDNIIFTGDLIFDNGTVGVYDHKYANISDLKKSVDRMLRLPRGTKVYPGHGESFLIEDFQKLYSMFNIPS